MANQIPTNSDEIDLGQLVQLIKKGFNRIFRGFLGFYIYIKKNIYILSALVLIGVGVGYGLKQVITEKWKTDIIVKPNREAKNYLYDVVDEISANIKSKNTDFFKAIGITIENFKGYNITIEPITNKSNIDLEYLELLQKFEGNVAVSDVVRSEILNKSSLKHRVTIYYFIRKFTPFLFFYIIYCYSML